MAVIDTDRGPILVSDPIELGPGDIISITRKVRMQYANDYFSGAMRITALENGELNLTPGTDRWDSNLGQIVANVDYLHYFYMDDHKAATDGFVLYDVSAGGFSAAKIQTPVFGEWFDETLTYNASTGETSWTFNGDTSTAQGLPLQQPAISVIMHCYGWYDGHSMDIDELEIVVTKGS